MIDVSTLYIGSAVVTCTICFIRELKQRRTSTGSRLFALLSRNFDQIFGQIVSIRIKTLSNTKTVAPRLIKREKGLLPVDVRRSKTSLPKGLFALGRKIRFGVYKKIENFVNANFWFLWARSHLRLANFL